MGAEEIVPESTRKNGGIITVKKNRAKRKSGNLLKRAQQNFERDPRPKKCHASETLSTYIRGQKQEFTNEVRDLVIHKCQIDYCVYRGIIHNNALEQQ